MDRLMNILLNSKKVMNKVENNDFAHGNIDRAMLTMDTDNAVQGEAPMMEGNIERPVQAPRQLSENEYKASVNNSKLPDAIKEAMLTKQIVQPDLNINNSLSLEFTDKVAKAMEKQGLKSAPQQQKKLAPKPLKEERTSHIDDYSTGNIGRKAAPTNSSMSLNETIINEMKPLIKEIIQSTLEATIEKILTEKFAKQEKETLKINENLRIQVGDSIFVGKITGVKQQKK
jgi:hypothetical protein